MIEIDIVCPVYKGLDYLEKLYETFYTQEGVKINNIVFPVTIDDVEIDSIRQFINKNNIKSFEVTKEEFSHSLTREKAIKDFCSSNIVVMISQDIILTNSKVFYNLVKSIDEEETVYNYARQICKNKSIEKYIRKKNYGEKSYIIEKKDVEEMQLMAFFASDACSAYNRRIFIQLGGYGGHNVMMNEDQLYSKIILENGYKKKYCADAVVEHSHKYTLKQLYKRYYETGKFYKEIKVFNEYKSTNTGMKLALYVLKEALKHFDILVLLRWLPDMTARYLGLKKGKEE